MSELPHDDDPIADPAMQLAGRLILEGRLQDAEAKLLEVIAQRPDDPEPHYALGVIYMNSDRLAEADTKFRRAIELDPEFAEAWCNLGLALGTAGKQADAIAALQRATEIDPELADAHSKLADMLLLQGRRIEAIASFRRAAAAAADSPLGLLAEARALENELRLPEAEALFRKFIATGPKAQMATAYAHLGTVLAQLGRFDKAVACFDQAIARAPAGPDGHFAYFGRVSAAKVTEADRPLVDQMFALLDARMSDGVRMSLHFGLGKALDDLGDYAGAIRQFDAANAIRRRDRRLNRAGLASWTDRLITRCTPEFFARNADSASDSPLPLLVLGMPRSGTTLLEQILSSHPGIAAAGELTFWSEHGPAWDRAGPAGFGVERAAVLARNYVGTLADISIGALRVIDKNPWNFQWIGMIRQAFSNARFIHCRRHPVDTCLSVYFTHFDIPQDFMSDRSDLVFYYREYARLMEHWRRVLPPDRYTEVDYTALVSDREAEARRLIAFCGLEWDNACLHHEANSRPVQTSSIWQVRQPLYRSSLERWRRYDPWLGEFRQLLPAPCDAGEPADKM
jgi:tetratricopeptide (TPR) repeat protein